MMDELTQIAIKYESDRQPYSKHSYTPYYFRLFSPIRNSVKKILEIGVGGGAGLKMWRDFFPNAKIYGFDIDPKWIFQDVKINTFLLDQSKKDDLLNLLEKTGTDFDIVIDDASHKAEDQVFTCNFFMQKLPINVIYIIEDVADPSIIDKLIGYDLEVPVLHPLHRRYDDKLIVVRNKK